MKIIAFLFTAFISLQMSGQEKFPDGTPIPDSAAPSSSSRKRIYTWKKVQC